MKNALSAKLVPRQRNPNGSRVSHEQHHDRTRLPPNQWPPTFLKAFAKLAKVTQQRRTDALRHLSELVKARWAKREHPLHYAKELLVSDIEEAIRQFSGEEYNAGRDSIHPSDSGDGDVPILDADGDSLHGNEDDPVVEQPAVATMTTVQEQRARMKKIRRANRKLGM